MNNTPFYGTGSYYPTYPTPNYIPNSTFQPNVQPSLINGRPVDNLEEITAGEVPLNGSLAVFPKKDGSMIYVKSTNGNGTIDTKCYIPAAENVIDVTPVGSTSSEQQPSISNQDIMAAVLNIQDQVNNIKNLVQKRPKTNYKQRNQNGTQGKVEDNA